MKKINKAALVIASASLALTGTLCLAGCQGGQPSGEQETEQSEKNMSAELGIFGQSDDGYDESIPEYMKEELAENQEKEELSEEALASGVESAFNGVSAANMVGLNNTDIIKQLIKSGCTQSISSDGSAYWVGKDKTTVYTIKDMDFKALSPSQAGKTSSTDSFLSVSTLFPVADGWTLESVMKQVSGAQEITHFREENHDGKVSAVAVATSGDVSYLITATRPVENKADVIVNLYLGGTQSDAGKVADSFPLK